MQCSDNAAVAERPVKAEDHLRLVYYFANLLHRRGDPLDEGDLVSIGTIGLMQAVHRYDPSKGTKFGTFAAIVIRGAMLNARHCCRQFRQLPLDESGDEYDPPAPEEDRDALDVEALPALLGRLRPRCRKVIAMCYGVDGEHARTLTAIAAKLVTVHRILIHLFTNWTCQVAENSRVFRVEI